MARKIKIPNEHLKRFARQEQKRKLNVRTKRMYYLIVCEGEATEPNYFEGLKQSPRVWQRNRARFELFQSLP